MNAVLGFFCGAFLIVCLWSLPAIAPSAPPYQIGAAATRDSAEAVVRRYRDAIYTFEFTYRDTTFYAVAQHGVIVRTFEAQP